MEDVIYRIHDGRVEIKHSWGNWGKHIGEEFLLYLINHPEEIKPIPRWTEKEKEMAERDSYRFKYISKDLDREGKVMLWEHKPTYEDRNDIWRGNLSWLVIPSSDYPSLQPGECVALEDIK